MSLGARFALLLVPLFAVLDANATRALENADFAGLVNIGGGRRIYLERRGAGSPAVVLVGGLRASDADWGASDKSTPAVFPEVALGCAPARKTQRRPHMATYVLLTRFTDQGIRSAKDSPKRAEAFKKMAETFGTTVRELFWTQGRYDIVAIVEAPDELSVTALNLSISALGNVRAESLRAFSAAEMMTIVSQMV
jgi:uncharacterized protein with GYD domain